MAKDGNVRVPPDSTGKRVDAASLDDGGVSVYRQKMVLTGVSGTAEVVEVSLSAPAASAVGLVVRQAGPIDVNAHAISGTVTVTGGVAVSGTATVAGSVGATVLNNINISAMPAVTGLVGITAGAANIGFINHISATVSVALKGLYVGMANQSASRGPRMVPVSASANATIIAAPGAGMSIYVTHLMVSNASGTSTKARVGTSATAANVTMFLAGSGGGFVTHYEPPWKLSANEAFLASCKPSVDAILVNAHFFVASADAL